MRNSQLESDVRLPFAVYVKLKLSSAMSSNLCRGGGGGEGEIFQTIPQWTRSSQGRRRKTQKKHLELTRKFQWKSCSITRLYFLPSDPNRFSTFRTKMKPSQYPKKETKKGKKRERTGKGRKRQEKVETAVSLINPILLSAYAQTLNADI